MMSLKALGVLTFIKENPDIKISSRNIAKYVTQGKSAVNSALKELIALGFLEYVTEKVDTRFQSYYRVTCPDGTCPEIGPPLLLNMLNTTNINNTYDKEVFTNIIRTKAFSETENGKEEQVGYSFFEKSGSSDEELYADDIKDQTQKNKAVKKKEFNAHKEAKSKKKFLENSQKPVSEWNSTNVAWEFRRRVQDLWHVPPVINASRMNAAFGANRAKWNTSGEIEVEMMNIFFASITDLSNKTAETLWHSFTSQWGALAKRAVHNISLPTDLEKAKEQSELSMKRFMDV